ncbi:MAG: glycerophosphodiester phosphodiesterase family protein [Acidobacteriota bacterium]|nr:glycerophosphodiester phosphodiesterase family protein [Acidobacteriota bacterium]
MADPRMPEIVAHRGAGTDAVAPRRTACQRPAAPPENTLPAFAWGWSRATACELDVHLSRDERLIVIHDETTGRTCDRDLVVGGSTRAELATLDAGCKKGALWAGLRLPTLEEVLAAMPAGRRLYVELKNGAGIVGPLADAVRRAGKGPAEVVFISFDVDAIGEVKQRLPDHACYLVVAWRQRPADGVWEVRYGTTDRTDPRRLRTRARRPRSRRPGDPEDLYRTLIDLVRRPLAGEGGVALDGLDVSWRQPEGLAKALEEAGVAWGSWTVDTADAAVALRDRGAVQLTTNCPDDLRSALAHAAAGGRGGARR